MRDDVHVIRMPEPIPGSCDSPLERWADEVLDFPSVSALVDRMQAAFFAGESVTRPVRAEVVMSTAQASSGGVVPIEVPLWRPCGECGGRGEVDEEPCGACQGTGHRATLEPVDVFVPSGVRDGARFQLHLRVPSAPHTAVDLHVRVR
jgi:hypothetical protein